MAANNGVRSAGRSPPDFGEIVSECDSASASSHIRKSPVWQANLFMCRYFLGGPKTAHCRQDRFELNFGTSKFKVYEYRLKANYFL